ncbi:hypothetical protein B0J13DRAFT_283972 [Dactylonectria estremocensis]|uniref:Uncharacterized protein n=1 Tax=Dactylonectria estremocensis TaxID=1079267 RepID=A0A9P9EYF7_9HYPO|nr:hypothetical protein B0J13DRAFT_283972 [Dactylonectria estremocensis]
MHKVHSQFEFVPSTKNLAENLGAIEPSNMKEPVDERDFSSSLSSSQLTPRANRDRTSVSGRIGIPSKSPTTARNHEPDSPGEHNNSFDLHLIEEMEQEKTRYPGASGWAAAEEHLFEVLYLRQDLPMLPKTWDIDFSGVPMSDIVFQTSGKFPPIIYAHGKDFRGTMALLRLVDLTSTVRTSIQTGSRNKAPGIIKRELDKYLSWAAQDGDYAHLRIVPNIIAEVIDTTVPEAEITSYIKERMRALARLQREFLRVDSDPEFWDVVKPSIMVSPMVKMEFEDSSPTPLQRWPKDAPRRSDSILDPDELSTESPTRSRTVKQDAGRKRRWLLPSPTTIGDDELVQGSPDKAYGSATQGPPGKKIKIEECSGDESDPASPPPLKRPTTPPRITYRRDPPVVYGLFILNTTVLLLTVDSSQGDSAYVSFHVQANFQDPHQSVWHALTMALAVCIARDELITRTVDFDELPVIEESDPDA